MLEPDPQDILKALAARPDPGLRVLDWEILECLAAGLGSKLTAVRVRRTPETVRRRIAELEKVLLGGLGVEPNRQMLVSWYHLHRGDPPARRAS